MNIFDYIGKTIDIVMDRPLGSEHPKFKWRYPVNYGYIPDTVSGDGEEIDVFLLGVFESVNKYEGKCIAVIEREDDNEYKLVAVPEDKKYNKDQIEVLVEFQERFFNSKIIMEQDL
ncbi:MAG: inorganic diphosphatase [Clostridia bacterium]|jgi:inorganic pyrophosphatase|nr:inorganic diphosphatase [Clostridia bacterium]